MSGWARGSPEIGGREVHGGDSWRLSVMAAAARRRVAPARRRRRSASGCRPCPASSSARKRSGSLCSTRRKRASLRMNFPRSTFGGAESSMNGCLARRHRARVEAEERPVAGLDRQLLLLESVFEVVAVGDAGAVGDDQRRPRVGLRLEERLHGLRVLGAEGDARHVDVAVVHGHQPPDPSSRVLLPATGELGRRAERRGLRLLPAGVRVDLGVEHQDVHVAAERHHVVQTAEADVVGPAVTAHEPDALAHQVVGERVRASVPRPRSSGDSARRRSATRSRCAAMPALVVLLGRQHGVAQRLAHVGSQPRQQRLRPGHVLVHRQAHAQAELGVVFEERIGPGRTASVGVGGVGRGRQVAAVDRRAPGGVGDECAVAEELRHQLDVGRLAAARAGAGVLEQRLQELRALEVEFHLRAVGLG